MWWQFFTLFVGINTISADEIENDSSSCSSLVDIECVRGIAKPQFPGNEEELEEFCRYSLDYFNCTEHVLTRCEGNDEDVHQHLGEYAGSVRFNCEKYSLRYRVVLADENENGSPSCSSLIDLECASHGNIPQDIPSNKEELKDICKNSLNYFMCIEHVLDDCEGRDHHIRQHLGEYENLIRRICIEDFLFYTVLQIYLPCITKNQFTITFCHPSLRLDMDFFVDGLKQIGLSSIKDTNCLHTLYYYGCVAAGTEELCGDVASWAVTEVIQAFDSLFVDCPKTAKIRLGDIGEMMLTEAHRKLNTTRTP